MQNLNAEPVLPFGDATFDAVICNVSVQYLEYPEQVGCVFTVVKRRGSVRMKRGEFVLFVQVFREVRRILSPSGVFLITFR